MRSFLQTSDNDIAFYDGRFSLVKGKDAYGAIIADVIRTLRGEIQLDISLGVPYIDTVFMSLSGEYRWRAYVDERIRAFPFVEGIKNFTTDYDSKTKTLSYSIEVETTDGDVTITG